MKSYLQQQENFLSETALLTFKMISSATMIYTFITYSSSLCHSESVIQYFQAFLQK